MDYADYAELRRRAEKRLTRLSAWPLVLFQGTAYFLMMIRNPLDLGIPMLATLMAFGIGGVLLFVYRRLTAANKQVRRRAIDETLDDAIETGWPLEDPTPRELRLMASLLDDDMEARSGMGRVVVWSAAAAVMIWLFTYMMAGSMMYLEMFGPYQVIYPLIFMFWLAVLGGLTFGHRQVRKASAERVRTALKRATVWNPAKPKRAVEAPWWNEDFDDEKPKRIVVEEEEVVRVDDDGELPDDFDAIRRRRWLG